MMAHSGRDPLMWAALAIANQDAPHSGETCLRCHLPKGWLEGRSAPEDGSTMTADDRQGVQCGVCHRLVDPVAAPENPAEDAPILAALDAPVPTFGNAMFVIDPIDRRRGPFDVVADLGSDPHGAGVTLVSPFHESSDLCGTCHNLRNPAVPQERHDGRVRADRRRRAHPRPDDGLPRAVDVRRVEDQHVRHDRRLRAAVRRDDGMATTCQSCHMRPVVRPRCRTGLDRPNVPLHDFAGANTFIPSVLQYHPAFGAEVIPDHLAQGVVNATNMLRKAATVEATLAAGDLTVRVTNETGHKLPTGYPEGRRMWLHVRAYDAQRTVIFESGRYVFATATLSGYGAEPLDADYDPYLHVWESEQGISPALAPIVGLPAGRSFHLVLNNVVLSDNRIPPRGFTNAAFEAIDAAPVGAAYADGQYWDEVTYPVGVERGRRGRDALLPDGLTRVRRVPARREHHHCGRQHPLHALGSARRVTCRSRCTGPTSRRTRAWCRSAGEHREARGEVSQAATTKSGIACYANRVQGFSCDTAARDARIATEAARLRERLGGVRDVVCAGRNLTPGTSATLVVPGACASPCSTT